MKKIKALALILLFGISGIAQAQQSDYQITTEFEEKYSELLSEINNASTVAEIDSLRSQLDSLQIQYNEHEELLTAALYPSSYEQHIRELEQRAELFEHRLLVIENQSEKMDTLLSELAAYESEIQNLNQRVNSLRQQIATSESSESRLSDLVQNYRNSLEARDRLILGVLDSLLLRYEGMNSQTMAELGAESGKVDENENPLKIINSIIDENQAVLKANGQNLTTEDFLRIYVVQDRVSNVWDQIGNEMLTIYADDDKNWKPLIEEKLSEWHASASKNLWESLNEYLQENKLNLAAFDNRESFYAALDQYVTNARQDSEKKWFRSESDEFQNFIEFWNGKIKNDWHQYVREGEVLTSRQISSLDNEIVSWRENVRPQSYTLPILLGISILMIIGLVIVIARKNK